MRATFPLGLAFGWKRLTAVFVTGVALIAVGSAAGPAGWWAGLAISAAVAVAVLVTWRGAPLLTLAVTRVRPLDLSLPPPADHDRTFGAGPVGIRSVATHLVAVVAVDGPAHSPSVLVHHQVEAAATLPLGVAAAGLRQCDVTLAGIDIVSAGVRVAPTTHHHHAPVYSSRVGDHPAVGQRRTWLVLRLDAAKSVAAILWRESVAATLAGAAEHLAQRLTSLRIPARVLCASEIEQMDEVLLACDLGGLRRRWGRLRHTGGYVQTYWMSPQDISTAAIDRLWAPETDATVTTVQLRPTSGGGTAVGVLVRYHTGGPLREPPLTGLNPLTGRHDVGAAAGLAAPTGGLLVPTRQLRDRELLAAPIGASGIIVGATTAGHPLLIDLTPAPAKTTIVTITGEPALMVQVALRAAATGYRVIVNTAHHERWRQTTAAGLQLVGPGGLGERLPVSAQPWLVVYDETSGPIPDGAAVVVRGVDRDGAAGDVRIDQDDDRSAVIHTRALRCRVRIDLDHERRLVVHGEPGKTAA